jgi:hypothetical protein
MLCTWLHPDHIRTAMGLGEISVCIAIRKQLQLSETTVV